MIKISLWIHNHIFDPIKKLKINHTNDITYHPNY